jgi:hypothetical protein
VKDKATAKRIREISWAAYEAVGGRGYGRVDLRQDAGTGEIYVLEVNAQCGISEDEAYTSIGAILRFARCPFASAVREIIAVSADPGVVRGSRALAARAAAPRHAMKVCVLQPDYSTSGVDYRHYDPARDLEPPPPGTHRPSRGAAQGLHVSAAQAALHRKGFDIFVNLCEGYLEWDVPSIDVIHSLEALGCRTPAPRRCCTIRPSPS